MDNPKEFLLYYATLILVGVGYLLYRGPRRGFRLRFRGSARGGSGGRHGEILPIQGDFERPINVIFNYNGHSWDAFEVLGLPAGSGREAVDHAYQNALARVDPASRPFIESAYRAISSQWDMERAAGSR